MPSRLSAVYFVCTYIMPFNYLSIKEITVLSTKNMPKNNVISIKRLSCVQSHRLMTIY